MHGIYQVESFLRNQGKPKECAHVNLASVKGEVTAHCAQLTQSVFSKNFSPPSSSCARKVQIMITETYYGLISRSRDMKKVSSKNFLYGWHIVS